MYFARNYYKSSIVYLRLKCIYFDGNFACDPTIDCGWGKLYVTTEILHHCQEQARKPVADNGARCELPGVKGNVGRSTRTPDRIALT